jgi:NitT/TauT family transport system permease protein
VGQSGGLETRLQAILSVVLGLLLLGLWAGVVAVGHYPAFILPGPGVVATKALDVLSDGSLWRHARVTLFEVLAGLTLGSSEAVAVGYFLARWEWFERILSPYLMAAQSVPIVALAPLLVIWFGFGLLSKVLVCALVVFSPMLVATIVGLRSSPADLLDLMRVLRASRWATFTKVEVPSALPVLFGGLRLAVTLAVVGAVVGEFVGAQEGLGFLVNLAKGLFDTPLMFVALASLVVIAMSLYLGVLALERRLLSWRY